MKKGFFILQFLLLSILTTSIFSQKKIYDLDAKSPYQHIKVGHLDFHGQHPDGTKLSVNSAFFTKNGLPWFPVMGEFHYIRYPEQYWEEEILKMKSGGIDIVSTYIFWNAHENPKGIWDWKGIKNLRHFVDLCAKHHMYVWLRIGPWSHGEQLYGGHPEWIQHMKGRRSNNPEYLAESKELFLRIGQQTHSQYFKDGGPIIGVQLENEFASGDINHIDSLKAIALRSNITPVYFSVTANSVFKEKEYGVIPLQGAYPYRGWEKGGGKATKDFLYGDDQWIMTDALGKVYYDVNEYPKGMCEQGAGSQMSDENRFEVEPHVVEAHLNNQIGRGMNLIGYYMYQGGTQLPGLKEPGVPESYDFQAPLTEFGLSRKSYKYLKILHHFIHDFGSDVAQMVPVEPKNPVRDENNKDQLRYIGRFLGNKGFIFLGNTQVRVPMTDKKFQIKLQLKNEVLEIPKDEMVLKGETTAILPINMDLNGVLLKYATAQPLARIKNGNEEIIFLMSIPGMETELAFDTKSIKSYELEGGRSNIEDTDLTILTVMDGCVVYLTAANGNKSKVVILSRSEAENSWKYAKNGKEYLLITSADVMFEKDKIELRQLGNPIMDLKIFPGSSKLYILTNKPLSNSAVKQTANSTFNHFSNYPDIQKTYSFKVLKNIPDITIQKNSESHASVTLPMSFPSGVRDAFLEIKYLGGSADAIHKDKIVTDNLFSGTEPWVFGVKRYVNKKEKTVLNFRAKDWNDKITGVPPLIVQDIKTNGTKIVSIQPIPQYYFQFNIK